MTIRKIEVNDNAAVAAIVRNVLMELGAPKIGTAYADPYLDHLFEVYQQPNSVYFVVVHEGEVIGGAGIGPLINEPANYCELQKMYFMPAARGLGIGQQLMQQCLTAAKQFGYEFCYLETMPYMEAAQKLYKKVGFKVIDAPLGNTGHTSCPVWMLKSLV
ncbi:GNAT family N-acetyltransferase [Ferruginibacter yonginensis]|uniref:GNAT family N-acetyltransferase n=1 Tax=Ferruginibacter yonginensis TaxID=1310416 RepID=A0ABV8QT70_9BACT